METVTSKISDGSQCFSFIKGIHTLSCIFHNFQTMSAGNLHDRVHLAGNTRIMNRHDYFRSVCDCLLDQFLIDVHSIRPDIHEHDLRLTQNKCICG